LKAIRKAYAIDEVREYIEAVEKACHDEATRLAHAKKEGLREGLQEGRLEERHEIAAKMLANGLDRATILATTGLRPEDLPHP
jgi:predicted transposase/invertase (TIGR01784 family)